MADRVEAAARSRIMAAVRSQDTRPEKWVRAALHRQGFRFRLHTKSIPGSPDLVLRRYKAVVLVHGCFWHQHPHCPAAHVPKSRSEFWERKFARNVARDQKVLYQLKVAGWRAAVIWECGLKPKQRQQTIRRLAMWLKGGAEYLEIPVYDEFSQA